MLPQRPEAIPRISEDLSVFQPEGIPFLGVPKSVRILISSNKLPYLYLRILAADRGPINIILYV